jgi:rubredoxin
MFVLQPLKFGRWAAGATLLTKGGDLMPSWRCQNCAYTFEKDVPPDTCPSCKEKCEFLDNTCYTPDCEAEGVDKRIK